MFSLTMAQKEAVASPQSPSAAAGGGETVTPADQMAPQELLRNIVDMVNSALQRSYSLVDFDQLSTAQLLQVVNDVFAKLQPSITADLESVKMDEHMPKMLDFLTKTLGYRVPPFIQGSFPESFAKGETTVIYPTLYWVLTHMDQNAKRVYLARFLQPLDIPDDIRAQDEDVRNLFNEYQQLRQAFVQTHRHVDGIRAAFADPAEATRKVTALEEEKERLNGYIQAAEKKLSSVKDKEALLAASRSLRLAQEEDAGLAERRVEQQQKKISAELKRTEMSARLQNIRRDMADGRAEMMVRRMADETQTNKIKLEEQLPREIDQKKKENAEFQKLLSEPLDMQALTAEERQLDEAVKGLQERVKARMRPGGDGTSIATIKQQVDRVKARKQELMNELSSLQIDNSRAVADIREKENHIQQLRQATNMLQGDAFKQFSDEVRAKKTATETLRSRLAEQRAEWGTLSYTETILQEQFDQLDREIGNLESKLGLQGYSRAVERLSKLTNEQETLEEVKGKTLEELSRVVQDFTLAIREGRTRLAPLINELRTVRQTAAEVDQEWSEKKSQYDYQQSLLMEDIQKLDDDVTQLKRDTSANESLYHRIRAQMVLQRAMVKRADEEQQFRTDPSISLDPSHKTYADFFADHTKILEQRTKDLQMRRRDVEDNHDSSAQQVVWFNNLKSILTAKLRSLKQERGPSGDVVPAAIGRSNAVTSIDLDIQQVMGVHRGGADMLVLNGN